MRSAGFPRDAHVSEVRSDMSVRVNIIETSSAARAQLRGVAHFTGKRLVPRYDICHMIDAEKNRLVWQRFEDEIIFTFSGLLVEIYWYPNALEIAIV